MLSLVETGSVVLDTIKIRNVYRKQYISLVIRKVVLSTSELKRSLENGIYFGLIDKTLYPSIAELVVINLISSREPCIHARY